MRIVFFGSAPIGFPVLDALLANSQDEVVAVVTQPDRPAGRQMRLTPCPIKAFSQQKRGLNVLSPEKIGEIQEELSALRADLFVVVAYGQYLPRSVLALPKYGAINLHPSLLPKYRGSSPIQWAVANGDTVTGVTILYVSEKMDAGDILLQKEVPIGSEDTSVTLESVLAEAGAQLMTEAVEQIRRGTVSSRPQDETAMIQVRKLVKEDGVIDWTLPAEILRNRIRGFLPWPGCFCKVPVDAGLQRLKILRAAVEPGCGLPGEVLDTAGEGPLVATGKDALRLLEVQPSGKRVMDGASWLRGRPLSRGTRLA
ncbi:MAG: methionyl-tRNA formyltransferase [Verrucomicrobiota bacterium]|jgi:methionyl-tRNA formyltransferase|nr:methionyl-tRNA formyltransferase [Verrucomicrobiota bacterium]